MTRYLVYKQDASPYLVEHKLSFQTFDEKIHFAKQLLVNLSAVQVEFEHADSRYTIEFDIQNTL